MAARLLIRAPMMHSLFRSWNLALATIALLPATVAAQKTTSSKIDETLRESIERGCVGMQPAIITVATGQREGLRQVLAAHGDVVSGEFPAIDAIAATVHCGDLTALADFGSVRAVSTNATVGVSASGVGEVEGRLARDLKKTHFATLGATKFRDVKAGHKIGVAVIDSGIEPGTDFDNRITAFYDFTHGDIRSVAAHDDYGHGTHVAGLIGSEFVGVAPHSRLIGLKVLDSRGQGTTDNVVRAIEFAVTNRHVLGINVLNVSLGHPIYRTRGHRPAGAGG